MFCLGQALIMIRFLDTFQIFDLKDWLTGKGAITWLSHPPQCWWSHSERYWSNEIGNKSIILGMYYRYMWVFHCMNYKSCCGLHALAILSSHLWQHTAAGSNAFNIYHKISNIRRTKSPNLNVSPLDLQLSLPNPMRPGVEVENEDVVGAAPTGDASTTSEWSTILLPTKVHLILETWHYICYNFKKGDCFRENNNASEWQVGERKILISHVIYLQVYTSNAQYISFVLVHQIFMLYMIQ